MYGVMCCSMEVVRGLVYVGMWYGVLRYVVFRVVCGACYVVVLCYMVVGDVVCWCIVVG